LFAKTPIHERPIENVICSEFHWELSGWFLGPLIVLERLIVFASFLNAELFGHDRSQSTGHVMAGIFGLGRDSSFNNSFFNHIF
jgi:hypothetical protein